MVLAALQHQSGFRRMMIRQAGQDENANPHRLRDELRLSAGNAADCDAQCPLFQGVRSRAAGFPHLQSTGTDRKLSRQLRQLVQSFCRPARALHLRHRCGDPRPRHLRDGRPDGLAARSARPAVGHAPVPAAQPLLRERCAGERSVAAVRQHAARRSACPGGLRLRSQPHRFQLRQCAADAHGSRSLSRTKRCLPRLRASRGRLLPGAEHPDPLLHRLHQRHRHAKTMVEHGLRRLDGGLSRWPMACHSIRATMRRASAAS